MSTGPGSVASIHIARFATAPTESITEVQAVPGKGLAGDRYFMRAGTFGKNFGPDNELTLIELEAIEALERDYHVALKPGEARRNLVIRGVALNHLVGREFQVGAVTLRGLSLCEPCSHLEKLTSHGVISGLIHRGGLRAQILTEGIIRVSDAVLEHSPQETTAGLTPASLSAATY